jgi:hypothetical protein
MKRIQTTLKFLTAIALLAFVGGCASNDLQNKENLAVAAGFKVITPKTADQQARLAQLPAGRVTPVKYKGKTYYVLPDVKNNQAYVGRASEYQAYQQLRLVNKLSNDNLEAAEMNENASMGWGWGGWGGWGMGWGPGWY